jgi:hypothetical protein
MKYKSYIIKEMRVLVEILKARNVSELVYGYTVAELDEVVLEMEKKVAEVDAARRAVRSEVLGRELQFQRLQEVRLGCVNSIRGNPKLGGTSSPILREFGLKTRLEIVGYSTVLPGPPKEVLPKEVLPEEVLPEDMGLLSMNIPSSGQMPDELVDGYQSIPSGISPDLL